MIQKKQMCAEYVVDRWPPTIWKRWNYTNCLIQIHIGYQVLPTRLSGLLNYCPYPVLMQDYSEYHAVGLGGVVFDPRHGGCIKWARDALTLEKTNSEKVSTTTFATLPLSLYPNTGNRLSSCEDNENVHGRRYSIHINHNVEVRLLITPSDLRAVARSHVDILVQHWLSLSLGPTGGHRDVLLGRLWCPHWEHVADYPQYPLGVWLGYNSSDEDRICLSAQNPELEVTASMSIVPYVLPGPRQGESSGFPGYAHRAVSPVSSQRQKAIIFLRGSAWVIGSMSRNLTLARCASNSS